MGTAILERYNYNANEHVYREPKMIIKLLMPFKCWKTNYIGIVQKT